MTEQNTAGTGVEDRVARPGGVSYLRIPARDIAESAQFYRAVFGWRLRGSPDAPSFSDGTGHVIGHWRTDLPAAGQAGILPYIYVTGLDDTLRAAAAHGAQIVTPPYPEGNLSVTTIRDPAGNAEPAGAALSRPCRYAHAPSRGAPAGRRPNDVR
jgi:predicted enzyme related to lactoylglutathione lyase